MAGLHCEDIVTASLTRTPGDHSLALGTNIREEWKNSPSEREEGGATLYYE